MIVYVLSIKGKNSGVYDNFNMAWDAGWKATNQCKDGTYTIEQFELKNNNSIDLRTLYIELISDLDPFCDMSEHESLSESEMLYNLQEIKENDLESIDDDVLVDRFNKVIDLFKSMGIDAYC